MPSHGTIFFPKLLKNAIILLPHIWEKKNSNDFKRVGDSLTPHIMSILNYEKSIIYKSKQDIFKS